MKKALSSFVTYPLGKWKRALLLSPFLVVIFLVAVIELSHAVISNVNVAHIVSALTSPLTMFAERSPGGRGPGELLSTKPNFEPHERVLSSVREREHPSEPISPDFAIAPEDLEAIGGPPGNGTLSEEQLAGSSPVGNSSVGNGMVPEGTLGVPIILPGDRIGPQDQIAGIFNSNIPLGIDTIPEGQSLDLLPFEKLSLGITPENQPLVSLPLGIPTVPSSALPHAVPEPATWGVVLFGLFIIGITRHRRLYKQRDQAGER